MRTICRDIFKYTVSMLSPRKHISVIMKHTKVLKLHPLEDVESACGDARKSVPDGRMKNGYSSIENSPYQHIISAAVNSLKQGGVISIPTDTIYGVTSTVQNQEAVNQLYRIKQRDDNKPIAICVSEIEDIYKWAQVNVPDDLLRDLLPGPVTVVFNRQPNLNPSFNPGTNLVGVRIPDHTFVRDLCRGCGEPLALTSANVSASQSTLAVQEFQSLWPQLDLVVDGGLLGNTPEARLGSTVINFATTGSYTIIRNGSAKERTVALLQKHGLFENTKR